MPETHFLKTSDILVVEPDWPSCAKICESLHTLGLSFRVTTMGDILMNSMAHQTAGLLILGLPVDPNHSFQQHLGLLAHYPSALTLGVTSDLMSDHRAHLIKSGIDFLLSRPFTTDESTASIQALLRRQRRSND